MTSEPARDSETLSAPPTTCDICGSATGNPSHGNCTPTYCRATQATVRAYVAALRAERDRESFLLNDLRTKHEALRDAMIAAADESAALRAECTRLRAALGMNVEYRDLTGCEHAIHESCDKCVCPTCRTRAVQTKELGWMPVTAFPARAAAPTPGETTNG